MEKKFDFKSWVLVRNYDDQKWDLDIYGYYDEDCNQYVCVGGSYNQCISHKGNEHLLGTSDNYEQWQPKDGDFVYVQCKGGNEYIYIQKGGYITKSYVNIWLNNNSIGDSSYICFASSIMQIRPATKSEKQQLLDALHKENKDWDAEKKQIVEYKWKPKEGELYFFLHSNGKIHETGWAGINIDRERYEIGNCFRTEEEAQAVANKFKQLLKGNK